MNSELKQRFIELAIRANVLKFGEFKLKSGRISPYFFNAGLFYHGETLKALGQCYAEVLLKEQAEFDHLFGPAYKGLPLATAAAIALADAGKNCTVTFNRKEAKMHGEGGQLIGAALSGNTIIIDDVITAGTAFREARQQIEAEGAKLTAVIIALNRAEKGLGEKSAIEEIREQRIKVYSIIDFFDLVDYLTGKGESEKVAKLMDYHQRYGI